MALPPPKAPHSARRALCFRSSAIGARCYRHQCVLTWGSPVGSGNLGLSAQPSEMLDASSGAITDVKSHKPTSGVPKTATGPPQVNDVRLLMHSVGDRRRAILRSKPDGGNPPLRGVPFTRARSAPWGGGGRICPKTLESVCLPLDRAPSPSAFCLSEAQDFRSVADV